MKPADLRLILRLQKNEITEHHIYLRLADQAKDPQNAELLRRIAADELKHYEAWRSVTGLAVQYSRPRLLLFVALSRVFGLAFGLRLMERGEELAKQVYERLADRFPDFRHRILMDEQRHEKELIGLLNDIRLSYAGSIVLGLNDALVEFTGTLAGLTLAIPDTRMIGVTGIVLGVAASLSMASSEFLSSREKDAERSESDAAVSPLKSALYTGVSYALTVTILTTPYFLTDQLHIALGAMLGGAVIVIALYTFYISTARSAPFWPRFLEMLAISMGVAVISFGVGWFLRIYMNVEV
ncbi:MAG: VIT1/CCC1 transporter family protein [bacterium]|nr:VIT1/CCC1 transporter family protein [bacterium]